MALDTAIIGPLRLDVTRLNRYVLFDVAAYAVASLSCSPGFDLDSGAGVIVWEQAADNMTWLAYGQTFTAANMTSGHTIQNMDVDTVRHLRARVSTAGTGGEIYITVIAKAGANV